MAHAFNVELLLPETPAEAQARAATALADPARAIGLRLTGRANGELSFWPRVQFPFVVMLWHNLNRERMTVRFEPADAGGTTVTVCGAVARGKHALASDPDLWVEALGGSARSV